MKWYFWADVPRGGAANMAIDDALLQQAADIGCLLRFYRWSQPTVSVGYFQPHAAAVPAAKGCDVVRRPSGGGVVDHRADFTFSLVFCAEHPLFQVDRFDSYRRINHAVAAALRDLGVDCRLHGDDVPQTVDRRVMQCFVTPARFDVVGAVGKLCGGAQRRRSEGMLHQGSIVVSLARDGLAAALFARFKELLGTDVEAQTSWPEVESLAATMVAEQYGNQAWTHRR